MAVEYFSYVRGLAWPGDKRDAPAFLRGDADAERPERDTAKGDQFYSEQTGTIWKSTGESTWLEIGEVGQPRTERLFASSLPIVGIMTPIGRDIYWIYVGQMAREIRPKHGEFFAVSGIGDILIDVAVASSLLPPNKSSQVLTVLNWAGSVRIVETPRVLRNDPPLNCVVAPGTHLWVGVKIDADPGAAQPDVLALGYDLGHGRVLQTANAGFGNPTYVGSIIPASASPICPHVVLTLD